MVLGRYSSLSPAQSLPELKALFETKKATNAFGDVDDKSWFRIKNESDTEAEVFIYDHIGEFGVTADDFVREFSDIHANKITVRINSPGGEVWDALAIYNAIRRHKADVTTIVDGVAASAASFVAMAGDHVLMAPHAQLLIHDAHGLTVGNAADMREMATMLDKMSDNIAAVYAEHTGGSIEEWRERMKVEMLISDVEAVELGLADEIDGGDEVKAQAAVTITARADHIDKPTASEIFTKLVKEQSEAVFAA